MPGHFGQKKNRIVTGSSPVTTQVPHAVGIALAGKMEGKDLVTFVTFGEGSSNQGDFHEGANFAGVHKLPVIFMCENNKYAISVPIEKQLSCENVSDRAIGYGMPGITVDGNDPLAVYAAVKEAADRARRGEGPTLVETVSYRLTPHSSDDDDRSYRTADEVAEAKTKDSIMTFGAYLKEVGIMDDDLEKQMNDEVMKIVNEATDYAENAPYPKAESAMNHVYAQK
jgi:2-oxoisovalerate dehydrogenase E1 component alpha subunit